MNIVYGGDSYKADLVLNNNSGGTVSLVEVKSYPRVSQPTIAGTLNQLESYAQHIDRRPLRYFAILSTSTGYIKDLKTNKHIDFDTKPILNEYLSTQEKKLINPRLLNAIYSAWLRDLAFGFRDKKLTKPEEKLKEFGFINNIKNTSPFYEIAP